MIANSGIPLSEVARNEAAAFVIVVGGDVLYLRPSSPILIQIGLTGRGRLRAEFALSGMLWVDPGRQYLVVQYNSLRNDN